MNFYLTNKIENYNNEEFNNIVKEIVSNNKVLEMKNYRQHFNVSTYEHCYLAAMLSYKVGKKLNVDYVSLTRAAMLHDMYLYDWREKSTRSKNHPTMHGIRACNNAENIFNLSSKEKNIIKSHMWPLFVEMPKSKEALLLTFIDKYCALYESSICIFSNIKNKIVA